MRNLFLTVLFILSSFLSFSQILETSIIILREDSIENQLQGTHEYLIIQIEKTIKVISKLDSHEFVLFKFENKYVFPESHQIFEMDSEISEGNTDIYLKKMFEISKNESTEIHLYFQPPKVKRSFTKEIINGKEWTNIEETYEGVNEYISFKIYNKENELSLKAY